MKIQRVWGREYGFIIVTWEGLKGGKWIRVFLSRAAGLILASWGFSRICWTDLINAAFLQTDPGQTHTTLSLFDFFMMSLIIVFDKNILDGCSYWGRRPSILCIQFELHVWDFASLCLWCVVVCVCVCFRIINLCH